LHHFPFEAISVFLATIPTGSLVGRCLIDVIDTRKFSFEIFRHRRNFARLIVKENKS